MGMVAIVAFGNYEIEQPHPDLVPRIQEIIGEIESLMAGGGRLPRYVHGTIPTVNSAGVPFSQETLCPGRYLTAALMDAEVFKTEPDLNAVYGRGWQDGWESSSITARRAIALMDTSPAPPFLRD